MGFWSGIKHAINSTLGTEDFKSLDKIILGSKGLVASDNFYTSVYNENVSMEEGFSVDFLKMRWPGSVRLKLSAVVPSMRPSYVNITVNGVTFDRFVVPVDSNGYEGTLDITGLKVGDIIGLNITNHSCNLKSLSISADVTDMSALEILV